MLFNSIQFVIFFLIIAVCYYIAAPKYRWILLLATSYYFYMCWNPLYILLILFSTTITYFAVIKIAETKKENLKKRYLLTSLLANLGVLLGFKYFNFFNDSMSHFFGFFNIPYRIPAFNLLLPIGISFYTFKTLSYTIDIYRGKMKAEKHFGIFALYVSFFPELIAGPIDRAPQLLPQFYETKNVTYENITQGIKFIIWGFFMKLVVADRAAIYVDAVYNNAAHHNGITFIVATVMFAFQIYCDFAGYSNIAIGCGKILGFDLMENFNRPYFATSIKEFWRRWHISLSTWFRDYVYIPLGGSRVIKWRWYYNLFITFLISGLWHGASWTFVIWGALHGFYFVITLMINDIGNKLKIPKLQANFFLKTISIITTFIAVSIGWVFFRANNVSDAFLIIQKILHPQGIPFFGGGADVAAPVYALFAIILLFLIELKEEFLSIHIPFIEEHPETASLFAYAALVAVILLLGVFDGGQFIYFKF